MDAILDFSKCSSVTQVHPADSERGHPRLLISIIKKTLYKNFRFPPKIEFGNWTKSAFRQQSSCNETGGIVEREVLSKWCSGNRL